MRMSKNSHENLMKEKKSKKPRATQRKIPFQHSYSIIRVSIACPVLYIFPLITKLLCPLYAREKWTTTAIWIYPNNSSFSGRVGTNRKPKLELPLPPTTKL